MAVRVLVVEESDGASSLVDILDSGDGIEPLQAGGLARVVDLVRTARPDVVVMVPPGEAAAVGAVELLMAREPVPILVVVGPTWSRELVLRAGAVDTILASTPAAVDAAELRSRVRLLSGVPTIRHIRGRDRVGPTASRLPIVGIAASTGGPQAVVKVLHGLGGLDAAVLVVQHVHPSFVDHLLEWFARESALPVEIAADGARIRPGTVYVSPADVHLKLGTPRSLELSPEPAVLHRPSADVLFQSLARNAGGDAVGVLLTGMGDDGATGLLAMRRSGARTIAQDEASSAVFGMPRAAQSIGAAEQVLALDEIPAAIVRAVAVRV